MPLSPGLSRIRSVVDVTKDYYRLLEVTKSYQRISNNFLIISNYFFVTLCNL